MSNGRNGTPNKFIGGLFIICLRFLEYLNNNGGGCTTFDKDTMNYVGTNLLLILITKFFGCVLKFLTSNDLNYSESDGRSVAHAQRIKSSLHWLRERENTTFNVVSIVTF